MATRTVPLKLVFRRAEQFGEKGIKTVLDLLEAAVIGATGVVQAKVVECLRSKWPRSSIAQTVSSDTKRTGEGIVGAVTIKHDWVGPLALGENVPPHVFPPRPPTKGPYVMMVGKKGKPKTYRSGPRRGQGPPVFISGALNHPGYAGKDCITPAADRGRGFLISGINKIAAALSRAIERGR